MGAPQCKYQRHLVSKQNIVDYNKNFPTWEFNGPYDPQPVARSKISPSLHLTISPNPGTGNIVIIGPLNSIDFNAFDGRDDLFRLDLKIDTNWIFQQGATITPSNPFLTLTQFDPSIVLGNYVAHTPTSLFLTLSGLSGFKDVYSVSPAALVLTLTLGAITVTPITTVRPSAPHVSLVLGVQEIATAQILQATALLLTLNIGSFSTIFIDTEELNPHAIYTVRTDPKKTSVQAIRKPNNVKYSQSRN